LKIRIFALAKELGMDSKVLIEYASKAGVQVKNSALASISPEERDTVVDFIEKDAAASSTAVADPSLIPRRPAGRKTTGKVRAIKTMSPRPQNGRRKRTGTTEAVATGTIEAEPGEETVGTGTGTAVADVTAAARVEEPPETESDATVGATDALPVAQPTSTGDVTDQTGQEIIPISRDDYVPASGTTGSSIREMKPRGTVSDSESVKSRQARAKGKQSLPNVAAPPAYKQPKLKVSKKEEQPAQKPDMKLTPDILQQAQSPLAGHLRKHAEQKRKRKQVGPAEPGAAKGVGKRGGGMGLVETHQKQRREQRKLARQMAEEEMRRTTRSRFSRRRRQKSVAPAALKTSAHIELPITLRGLCEALGRPAKLLQKTLFEQGQMITINENVDEETALTLAMEVGVDLEIKRERSIEDDLAAALESVDAEDTLVERPPIVTILGHVDHGKTTLLDKLRSANVAAGEAGGITQHIASYQVEHAGQKLTFVDTPGHAAFGKMRARGANVTDIVVLVVAADDGVMPQTAECISHAKAAGVPIVVALNKTDLPNANEQKVLQELAANDVLPAEWAGDTDVVRTSALTGEGLDDLLEHLLLTAEIHEFKANPNRQGIGVCLEAFRDEGRGAIAWLIVQKGMLRIGDVVLCGSAYGRIRAMYNDRDEEIKEAGPSTPVKVAGLDIVPGAGDHFFVVSDIERARSVAEERRHAGRTEGLARRRGGPRTLEDILGAAREGAVQNLPLIIKADTPGSIEALRSEIDKFEHPEVRVEIVHDGVGGVNESDIYLASASEAIVIAFHVIPEDRAQILAEREGVDVRRYNIIYEVTAEIKRALEGLLEPERVEVSTGRALVLQTFHISRFGTIAGCRLLSGTIERSNRVHVIRDQTVLNDYNIASLKREKDDVKQVREGMECGIRLEGFNDVKEGDLLEAYRVDKVKRTLD